MSKEFHYLVIRELDLPTDPRTGQRFSRFSECIEYMLEDGWELHGPPLPYGHHNKYVMQGMFACDEQETVGEAVIAETLQALIDKVDRLEERINASS